MVVYMLSNASCAFDVVDFVPEELWKKPIRIFFCLVSGAEVAVVVIKITLYYPFKSMGCDLLMILGSLHMHNLSKKTYAVRIFSFTVLRVVTSPHSLNPPSSGFFVPVKLVQYSKHAGGREY